MGTDACAVSLTILQPLTVTSSISNTATAPPHVEHGCLASAGLLAKPPSAELPVKLLFWRFSAGFVDRRLIEDACAQVHEGGAEVANSVGDGFGGGRGYAPGGQVEAC